MAIEQHGLMVPFKAQEDLSGQQYRFVCLEDNDQVRMPNAATDYPIGILQNAPTAGERAVVMVSGISKIVCNAALAVGAKVKMEYVSVSDNGKADAADTAKDNVRGIMVFAGGAENDVGSCLLVSDTLYAT